MNDNENEPPIVHASLSEFKPLPEGPQQYPLEYIDNNSVIKLREIDGIVHIGICHPDNRSLIEDLKTFHKDKSTIFYEIDRNELTAFLGERLSEESGREKRQDSIVDERLLLDKLANDAPIVNLVNSIIIEALRRGASDIHFECFAQEFTVRYRLDGYLHVVNRIEREKFQAVATRIKIMANLNIMERRLPQDGRITVNLTDDEIDMRVSVVPIADGESIVLRLFDKYKNSLELDQLGLQKEDVTLLHDTARMSNGLILVTGPTGSGKTTTLNAYLRHIRSDAFKIITIEDPIEYLTEGINQIQTNEAIGLTFDSLLRRIVRQDPDIIMVGEIRDLPTAELSIRSALTGHLVLSTLHTGDSVSVITRLENMGIEPYLIAAVLKASIAQRLVRKVCEHCRSEQSVPKNWKKICNNYNVEIKQTVVGQGCRMCFESGYRGRTGIFEVFKTTEQIGDMIATGIREADIRAHLKANNFRSLMVDGLQKVAQGVTTFLELERAVEE